MDFAYVIILAYSCFDQTQADFFASRASSIFPEDYDKLEPPWKKGDPAHVYLSLFVMDIDKIDDGNMEFSIQLFIREEWKDDRLNLTAFIKDSVEKCIFPPNLIIYLWQPDLIFDNTKDGKLFHLSIPNTEIKVLKEGGFIKYSRYNLLVGCSMDFHYYPMDKQECYLKIATLSNPNSKVELHWNEEKPAGEKIKSIELMYPIHPLKYVLREPRIYKNIEEWSDGNYTFLYANFTFDRRLSASLFNVYIPSTLVVFLSWISFWVDIEAVPARITLGVTSLLTLGTQVVQARAGLPDISHMTAMDVWLFACLIAVFGAVLEFAFAYQMFLLGRQRSIYDEKPQNAKCSKNELRILRSRLSQDRTLRMNHDGPSLKVNNTKFLDGISRKAFPLLFLIFSLIYWIYYLYLK